MRDFLFCGFLGVCTGVYGASLSQEKSAPLPPARWNTAPLLRELSAEEESLRSTAFSQLHKRKDVTLSLHPRSPGRVKPRTLLGKFTVGPDTMHMRITCQTENPETCCTEFMTLDPGYGWISKGSSGALPEAVMEKNGRPYASPINIHPYDFGYAFANALWEIPREGQRETDLFAYSPDRHEWESEGKVAWAETPPVKGACGL